MNKKVITFITVGFTGTLVDFLVYSVLNRLIFTREDQLVFSGLCAGCVAMIVNFFLHKNFTWKDRTITPKTAPLFFLWNISIVLILRPVLINLFGYLDFFYNICYNINTGLSLPFSFSFIRNTGIYGFMTVVTMLVNFFGYEKIVFGQKDLKKD